MKGDDELLAAFVVSFHSSGSFFEAIALPSAQPLAIIAAL